MGEKRYFQKTHQSTGDPAAVQIWRCIRELRVFRQQDVVDRGVATGKWISLHVNAWMEAGYLWREPVRQGRYWLVRDTGPLAPTVEVSTGRVFDPNRNEAMPPVTRVWPGPPQASCSVQGKLWRSMRILSQFCRGDLQEATELKAEPCDRYLKALLRAGYFRLMGENAMGYPVYLLTRDTGPMPPTVHNGWKLVWDHNDELVYEM